MTASTAIGAARASQTVATARSSRPAGSFARLLAQMEQRLATGIASEPGAAATGRPLDPAIELQVRVYREAERVELVSKLVDHAVSAAKTVLQTKV